MQPCNIELRNRTPAKKAEMKLPISLLIAALLLAFGSLALAHSGGTNAYGCHNNHKTGGYDCH